ncbi:hypothetical protein GCM10022254_58820 [Actinomadura meridiana]|uniref:Uncharacterized protein n=1 Tax=Actinomadura meridiana TaxID=559626 RepID=A0ABP8CH99_9ACTN
MRLPGHDQPVATFKGQIVHHNTQAAQKRAVGFELPDDQGKPNRMSLRPDLELVRLPARHDFGAPLKRSDAGEEAKGCGTASHSYEVSGKSQCGTSDPSGLRTVAGADAFDPRRQAWAGDRDSVGNGRVSPCRRDPPTRVLDTAILLRAGPR